MDEQTKLRHHNRKSLEREIARQSKKTNHPVTIGQANTVFELFAKIFKDTLLQLNGKIAIEGIGVFEVQRKRQGGGTTVRGTPKEEYTHTIRYAAPEKLSDEIRLKGKKLEQSLKKQRNLQKP